MKGLAGTWRHDVMLGGKIMLMMAVADHMNANWFQILAAEDAWPLFSSGHAFLPVDCIRPLFEGIPLKPTFYRTIRRMVVSLYRSCLKLEPYVIVFEASPYFIGFPLKLGISNSSSPKGEMMSTCQKSPMGELMRESLPTETSASRLLRLVRFGAKMQWSVPGQCVWMALFTHRNVGGVLQNSCEIWRENKLFSSKKSWWMSRISRWRRGESIDAMAGSWIARMENHFWGITNTKRNWDACIRAAMLRGRGLSIISIRFQIILKCVAT